MCVLYIILAPPSNKHLTAHKFPNSSHHQYFPPVSEQFTKRPRRLLEEIRCIYIYIYKTLISYHGNMQIVILKKNWSNATIWLKLIYLENNTTINKYLFHPPNQGKICFGNFVRAAFKASIFPTFTGITPTNFPNNTRMYYSSNTFSQSRVNPSQQLPVGSIPICSKNE